MASLAPATQARRRLSTGARARLAVALVVACCLGVVGLAVAGQVQTPPGVEFVQVGHWVYSSALQSALHVDGTTGQVDAQANVPGTAQGSQVVQGDRSGYVVERNRITLFSKSTLHVEYGISAPVNETPIALEVTGGPDLVYRGAGQIVRLGDPTATVSAGGPLAKPVATSDGTVWLLRTDTGSVCDLPRYTTQLTCPAQLPQGHIGLLAVVDDRPVVLDLTAGTMFRVDVHGLGEPSPFGIPVPTTALVADNAVDGRLAVIDPDQHRLLLIDTAGLGGHPPAQPLTVDLPGDGTFGGPVATAHTIAVLDQTSHQVLTYDSRGTRRSSTPVADAKGTARLTTGQDAHIYVDSPDGSHVLVINGGDGSVVNVDVNAQAKASASATPSTTTPSTTTGTSSGPPDTTQPPATTPPPARQVIAPPSPPGAPGAVSAIAGDAAATVRWAPAAPNGARVTGYRVSWPGGSVRVSGLTTTVTGLTDGTAYVFTVAAENSAGVGAGASARAVVPGHAADAPQVSASPSTGGALAVSWTAPNLHGANLVYYLVGVTGQGERQVTGTSAGYTGLSGTVTITVRAVTRYGSAGASMTGATGSQQATIPAVTGPATITILSVKSVSSGLLVTVNVDGKGDSGTTCQATFLGAPSAWVPCVGTTDIPINNVFWAGSITINATAKNSVGSGTDSWSGVPKVGGAVFWPLPLSLLALRRRPIFARDRKKDKS